MRTGVGQKTSHHTDTFLEVQHIISATPCLKASSCATLYLESLQSQDEQLGVMLVGERGEGNGGEATALQPVDHGGVDGHRLLRGDVGTILGRREGHTHQWAGDPWLHNVFRKGMLICQNVQHLACFKILNPARTSPSYRPNNSQYSLVPRPRHTRL